MCTPFIRQGWYEIKPNQPTIHTALSHIKQKAEKITTIDEVVYNKACTFHCKCVNDLVLKICNSLLREGE